MGDDVTNVIIPPQENIIGGMNDTTNDGTRDDVLLQFGEIRARTEGLYDQHARLESSIETLRGEIEAVRASLTGYALVGHSHDEYALDTHTHEVDPVTSTTGPAEEKQPDVEPEKQHFWFKRLWT